MILKDCITLVAIAIIMLWNEHTQNLGGIPQSLLTAWRLPPGRSSDLRWVCSRV